MGIAIISRGYGRQSQGLVEVSHRGRILATVEDSGDEPMLMALSLPYASVIVSEDRSIAIERAIESGVGLIILDDGFNRVEIEKLEILLEPKEIPNNLPLPSGPYRELASTKKVADIIAIEGRDFQREVSYKNLYEKMVLLTAIANPKRLDEYLPDGVVEKIYLDDHAYFYEETIAELIEYHNADSIIVTQKDMVKMSKFKLPISLIKLKLRIDDNIYHKIDTYLKDFDES
jgi:tetraacyldisaccharide 4'-kinase